VTFPKVRHAGFEQIEGEVEHPVFGKVRAFGNRALFEERS
jgi:hypothetical protein